MGRASTGVVLVLDGEADNAASVSELLSRAGHRVHKVARGDQALAALRERSVRLVLMDWSLDARPTGAELVRAIKRGHRLLPLIVMSSDFSALVEAGKAGADDYLPKPLDEKELLLLVEELAH
jgi:CheY-like chemotaxis protein